MPDIVIFGITAVALIVLSFVLYNILYPVMQKHAINKEIKNQKRLKKQHEERHRIEDANIQAREEAMNSSDS